MNTVSSYVVITGSPQATIINSGAPERKSWQLHNRGPAKLTVAVGFGGGNTTSELKPGDYLDVECYTVHVEVAAGDPFDAGIIEWQPRF